jgi:hypothetical protein
MINSRNTVNTISNVKGNDNVLSCYTACCCNIKNIATAMEVYRTDWPNYPHSLNDLVPDYIRCIPQAPGIVDGKKTNFDYSYKYDEKKDIARVYVKGDVYKDIDIPKNYPYFDTEEGYSFDKKSED